MADSPTQHDLHHHAYVERVVDLLDPDANDFLNAAPRGAVYQAHV